MRWLYHPLLLLIARSTDSQMAAHLEFLKAENQMLRRRLPKKLNPSKEEWEILLSIGTRVGNRAVQALITIVSYTSWVRQLRRARLRRGEPVLHPRKRGRTPTPDAVRELVIRLARENSSWGYTRILGELKKLGVHTSRTNVINILRGIAVDPKLDPTKGTWADFLRAHGQSLWQCDFFSKHVITPEGVQRQCFALVFIHMLSRRVFVSPGTFYPTATWKAQQATAFVAYAKSTGLSAGILFCDRDAKFQGNEFEGTLNDAGVKLHRLAFRAPNTNAYVERFIQTIQQECLDKFIAYDPIHLDYLVREYVEHYHTERPHQGKGNLPLTAGPPTVSAESSGEVVCRERLGGVLRHYYRVAA